MKTAKRPKPLKEVIRERFADNDNGFIYTLNNYIEIASDLDINFVREFKDYINWHRLSKNETLSEDIIFEFKNNIDWNTLIKRDIKIGKRFLTKVNDYLNIESAIIWQKLSCKQLDHYIDVKKHDMPKNFFTMISSQQNLTTWFIDKYKDGLDWVWVCAYQKMDEKFIEDHIKYIKDKNCWYNLCENQKLSEQFIERHIDKVNWNILSSEQKLSEQFIDKYANKVNWNNIFSSQKVSDTFIDKHIDKVVKDNLWYHVCSRQKLGEWFLNKHIKNIKYWDLLSIHQKLSEEFIKKHEDKLEWWAIRRYNKETMNDLSQEFIDEMNKKEEEKRKGWL